MSRFCSSMRLPPPPHILAHLRLPGFHAVAEATPKLGGLPGSLDEQDLESYSSRTLLQWLRFSFNRPETPAKDWISKQDHCWSLTALGLEGHVYHKLQPPVRPSTLLCKSVA